MIRGGGGGEGGRWWWGGRRGGGGEGLKRREGQDGLLKTYCWRHQWRKGRREGEGGGGGWKMKTVFRESRAEAQNSRVQQAEQANVHRRERRRQPLDWLDVLLLGLLRWVKTAHVLHFCDILSLSSCFLTCATLLHRSYFYSAPNK